MWEKIVTNLSKQLSRPQYESWIKPIKFLRTDERNIFLAVPNDYYKNWINKHFASHILKAVSDEMGSVLNLNIEVDPNLEVVQKDLNINDSLKPINTYDKLMHERQIQPLNRLNHNLNLKYTFDSFVVGPDNKFAFAMAKAVAENPGRAHNPLFLYGGVGLGKTHLMQAIGHYVYSKNPNFKVKYTTTEQFTNELIESLRGESRKRNASFDFRARYRQIDLLLVDDVQFLEGKKGTQEEFFNTFNALYESGKQIVLSSDRHPKKIPDLTERLVSRFEWGITADIQVPNLETRIAILKNKAQSDKMDVPNEVLEFIASAYHSNIRELEGALNRVIAYVGVTGCSMKVESIRNLIESTSTVKSLTPDLIIEAVAEYYKISTADIKGAARMKNISNARQVAIYLVREITQLSFPNIGDVFSKKHSTIIYAYEKVKKEININPSYAVEISEIKSSIT